MTISLSAATAGPPFSIHAEKVLLASMLNTLAIIAEVRAVILQPSDFYGSANETLYRALLEVDNHRQFDTTRELIDALLDLETPQVTMSGGALRSLTDDALTDEGALEQAQLVAEKARMRGLIEALSDTLTDAYRSTDGFDAILGRARSRLDALDATD